MNANNEPRHYALDAWRRLGGGQQQTEEQAEAFAFRYAASHAGASYDEVLAWLKDDLRVSREVGS